MNSENKASRQSWDEAGQRYVETLIRLGASENLITAAREAAAGPTYEESQAERRAKKLVYRKTLLQRVIARRIRMHSNSR